LIFIITIKDKIFFHIDTLKQWNVYGLDNVGKINPTSDKFYYLKDHLEGRKYQIDSSIYKFTGKERDVESNYDYFGARYYDARIGRWGQVDPLLEKHYDLSSYNFAVVGVPKVCVKTF